MKEKIKKFEKKYEAQDELLESRTLRNLDKRTLHETIKAMLINTTNDCIKYEIALDPEMEIISQNIIKENKTEEEIKKIRHAQERLRTYLHLASVSEESLEKLLYQMLLSDDIKNVFKQDMPELYNSLYYMIDLEDFIVDNLITELSESYEELSYKEICRIINNCIAEVVNNAEEYIDDIEEKELYEDFCEVREKWREKAKENANE